MRSNKVDFSDSKSQLDWADFLLVELNKEVEDFLKSKPYSITIEDGPDYWKRCFISLRSPLSPHFKAKVATIIQAQRASLDYLACALAVANDVLNLREVYFPITSSYSALMSPSTMNKIRLLHPDDQRKILDLKPYKGGNNTLFLLHDLNKVRKHRRLGVITISVIPEKIGGEGLFGGLVVHNTGAVSEKPNLALELKYDGTPEIFAKISLAFGDIPGVVPPAPVVDLLKDFSATCREVLELFEK